VQGQDIYRRANGVLPSTGLQTDKFISKFKMKYNYNSFWFTNKNEYC